jgi:hypothetical protein
VSDRPIYAPIRLRATAVGAGSGGPSATIVDADPQSAGGTALWDFSKLLGSRNRLDAGMVSEAKIVSIKTKTESGLDGLIEFEIVGHVARGTTSQEK